MFAHIQWYRFGARLCAAAIGVALLPLVCAAARAGNELSLSEAVRLAEAEAPSILARRSAGAAAQLLVDPAGQLPDPQLILGIDNLPIEGPDAGSLNADFMTMRRIGLMQEFPRREKRALRTQLAQADADRESALLLADRQMVRGAAAEAWVALYAAEQRLKLLDELPSFITAQIAAADAMVAAGRGSAADAVGVRQMRLMLDDRLAEATRDAQRARAALAQWISAAARRPLAEPPDFSKLPRTPEELLATIAAHHDLRAYAAMQRAAELDYALAKAELRADWSLELAYAKRGALYSDMLSVAARIDLPLFGKQRQNPTIAAKRIKIDQVESESQDAERRAILHIEQTLADWRASLERSARYEKAILPLARDRAALALAAYRGAGGGLEAALESLEAVVEQQIDYSERLRELGQAWAALAFIDTEEGRP